MTIRIENVTIDHDEAAWAMWTVLLVMDDGVETPHHISGTGAFLHGVICASDTVLKLEEWPRA